MAEKHIHILGIAGTFMASLAVLVKQLGYKVTGTDQQIYPPMSNVLKDHDIACIEGYDNQANYAQIDSADCTIVGNAISRGNPCVEYILDYKKNFSSGPQWLYQNLLQDKWVLAVSGTHGKTTTSSLLTWILEDNGFDPGFLIGGLANNFYSSSRLTQSKYFVIEADEYDTAFFDKRPKFLHYFPSTLIINNIEYDHADIYPNLSAIEQQFGYLLRTVPQKNGLVIAPIELEEKISDSSNALYKSGAGKIEYNFNYFSLETSNPKSSINAVLNKADGSEFEVSVGGKHIGKVVWSCLGVHNVSNAMAALLAAHHVGIDYYAAIRSLSSFKGVARRLEKKAELANNIVIYDDFAHHPTAIKTTLLGLRNRYLNRKLIVVLDFSSFSMRNKIHSDADFIDALDPADTVYFYQHQGMQWDSASLLNLSKAQNKEAYLFNNPDKLIMSMRHQLNSGDVVVFMTKSDFNKNINKLIEMLEVPCT